MKKDILIFFISIFTMFILHQRVSEIYAQNNDELFNRQRVLDAINKQNRNKEAEEKKLEIVKDIINNLFNLGSNVNTNGNPGQNGDNNASPSAYPSGPYGEIDPNNILNNSGLSYPGGILNNVRKCLSNQAVYKSASQHTGIPWQILAGIHYTEGSCDPNKSLVSGRPIGGNEPDVRSCTTANTGLGKPKPLRGGGCGFDNLLDTAVYAGNHLKGKISKIPETHQDLAAALSRYNGGGNSNCRGGTPYKFCPRLFEGEDDTYVFNKNPDGRHEVMYLRYCRDGRTCQELGLGAPVHQQYGVITVAGAVGSLAL